MKTPMEGKKRRRRKVVERTYKTKFERKILNKKERLQNKVLIQRHS